MMARLIMRMVEKGELPSEEELVMVQAVIKKAGEELVNGDIPTDDDQVIYSYLLNYVHVLYDSENQ